MDESVVRHLEQRNTTADVLRRASALVDTPEKWNHDAAGFGGGPCCAFLALMRAAGPRAEEIRDKYIMPVISGYKDLSAFNHAPQRTHPEILAAFDAAIALAEREGM